MNVSRRDFFRLVLAALVGGPPASAWARVRNYWPAQWYPRDGSGRFIYQPRQRPILMADIARLVETMQHVQ